MISTPILVEPGKALTGYTLPDILQHATRSFENPRMFNTRANGAWQSLSLSAFKEQVDQTALGLLNLGLQQGDRVGLYMESDTSFAVVDMACLIGGLVDVPLYLKQSAQNNEYILQHAEARVLVISSESQFTASGTDLGNLNTIEYIIVADPEQDAEYPKEKDGVTWLSLEAIQQKGKQNAGNKALPSDIAPQDLATIVYTSGTTGRPKGVMLTQQNMAFNALTGYAELGMNQDSHKQEVAISFLPLSHMFARTIHYSNLAFGISTYFSTPDELGEDLRAVRPTVMASVPRVVEKLYARIRTKIATLTGIPYRIASWSLSVAEKYQLNQRAPLWQRLKLSLADKLLLSKWREALGGRVKYIIAGGAAMSSELVNLFGAANISILQGYGLTETSPVISFSRPQANYPETVGQPLPGIEVQVAQDGELITRGPHVMKGYYKDPEKTRSVLTEDGWFHTGDIGEITDKGCIRITDRKKDLFKLSTGKYVLPQAIENKLNADALVAQSVVLGEGQKFCAGLIFVEEPALKQYAVQENLAYSSLDELLAHPEVLARYEACVQEANENMDHWNRIKQFKLIPEALSIENGMLTPTLKVKRKEVRSRFTTEIKELFTL